ncbi:MAG: glycosyltransferase family 61 protein, partial [Candidatus Hodarchaeales archaeon]
MGPPKGYIDNAYKWYEEYKKVDFKTDYELIFPAHSIDRKLPISIGQVIHDKFDNDESLKVKIPDSFILTVHYGRYLCAGSPHGLVGTIISPDDYLLYDLSHDFEIKPQEYNLFNSIRLPQLRIMNECIAVLTSSGADSYYHWIFDLLPKIHILKNSQNISFEEIDYFIVNNNKNRYAVETLNTLGISEQKIIYSRYNMHIKTENLIVPSMPGVTGNMPKWVCRFLSSELKPLDNPENTDYAEKIYITREGADTKKVINEYEIVDYLTKLGFEVVKPETMSVREQA